jgi:hypothetical protein
MWAISQDLVDAVQEFGALVDGTAEAKVMPITMDKKPVVVEVPLISVSVEIP